MPPKHNWSRTKMNTSPNPQHYYAKLSSPVPRMQKKASTTESPLHKPIGVRESYIVTFLHAHWLVLLATPQAGGGAMASWEWEVHKYWTQWSQTRQSSLHSYHLVLSSSSAFQHWTHTNLGWHLSVWPCILFLFFLSAFLHRRGSVCDRF